VTALRAADGPADQTADGTSASARWAYPTVILVANDVSVFARARWAVAVAVRRWCWTPPRRGTGPRPCILLAPGVVVCRAATCAPPPFVVGVARPPGSVEARGPQRRRGTGPRPSVLAAPPARLLPADESGTAQRARRAYGRRWVTALRAADGPADQTANGTSASARRTYPTVILLTNNVSAFAEARRAVAVDVWPAGPSAPHRGAI
jgi:hypothetical protein